jgi:hypothetical protein
MAAIFIKHDCPLEDTVVQRDKDNDREVFYLTKLSVAKIIYR